MCGIVGIYRANGLTSIDQAVLPRMLTALHHRGPDGSGRYLDRERGIAMGHTRLAIIDLSATGAQPIVNPSEGLVLSINGELYEFKRMRAELACRGERFETKTDSELALKLYRRYGLDFVQHLRGEFALALFDQKARRLILIRDRFGIRPLYYALAEGSLFFASEIKALVAHPETPRKLDTRAALHQMMQTMVPGMTAFTGIRALLPGHMLIATERGERLEIEQKNYWDVDFPLAEEHECDPQAEPYIEGVTERLIDAVRVRLEADVPVGCYLSGGIDSCSILGLATAMQQSPVKAFTISFDHDAYDEAAIATEMATATKADQEILSLSAPELYGQSYIKTAWHSERTFYNTLGVAKWHMSKRVRECGFKVVVTGEGSDEIFAGYPFLKRDFLLHAPEMLGRKDLKERLEESNKVFRGAILSEEPVEHPAMNDVCGFTPSWIQPWILTLAEARHLFAANTTEELEGYDPIAAIAESFNTEKLRGRHPLDKAQYTWIKTMLEGQILNWGGDRVDMANSMESRPPFLDHLLAEYAWKIPPTLRIREGVEKWVLREAMREILPELLYRREKFAFMAPPGHTDARKKVAMQQLADLYLSPELIDTVGLFDSNKIASFLESYWVERDPVKGARKDILFNHLVGLHIVHQELVA